MRHIGRLDHRIVIEQPTITEGDFGEPITSWSTFATVYAQRMNNKASGTEGVESGRELGIRNQNWVIRYISGLNLQMRINYDSSYYDIEGIEVQNRKESIILKTQEVI
jgi:head-tail adaptor